MRWTLRALILAVAAVVVVSAAVPVLVDLLRWVDATRPTPAHNGTRVSRRADVGQKTWEPLGTADPPSHKREEVVMRYLIVLFAVAAIGLAACGETQDSAPDSSDTTASISPGSAMGPGISVADALDNASGEPLLVNGVLFIGKDGTVTLASAMGESLPPVAAGDQLLVEGLNVDAYELSESQGEMWTDDPVQVLGIRNGDTLTVSDTLSG